MAAPLVGGRATPKVGLDNTGRVLGLLYEYAELPHGRAQGMQRPLAVSPKRVGPEVGQ